MQWTNQHNNKCVTRWYAVTPPAGLDVVTAFHWCKYHFSTGRFYNKYNTVCWYFELESDALLFTLKWGYK